MNLIVGKNYDDMSKTAAKIIANKIHENPNVVLGLATGSTPIGTYKELIKMCKEGSLDFSKVTSFNLDEYVSLDGSSPYSYRYFMNENFFDHINIDKNNTFVPDGKAEDLEECCKAYESKVEEAGGIDIQLLGIGENGHIAFIEPDSDLPMDTCIVKLTDDTIKVNSRFFDSIDEVPKTAVSMGIRSIMKAKSIVLLANGERKADAIRNIINCKGISTQVPASLLMLHPDFTIIVDEDAYGKSK